MSKVLVDTNVWVDVVLNRPQFVEASKGAIMACLEDDDEMLVAATSLKDVFYFASKSAGADSGYRAVELILDIATPAQIDAIVCKNALALEKPDYEDGIVAACALAEDPRRARVQRPRHSETFPSRIPGSTRILADRPVT